MSIIKKTLAQCRKCNAENEVTIYKSINVATDPELKGKLISGELFLTECPQCGTRSLLTYDCLYHDPDAKVMFWLLKDKENGGPEQESIMRQAAAMGDYRLRLVDNVGDLIEKVLITDAGLDDRCMELVKFVAGNELGGNVTNLHFFRIQDDVMVFSGMKEGQMQSFGFGLNVYEDCMGIIQRNSDIAKEDGFVRIDSDWVNSIVK